MFCYRIDPILANTRHILTLAFRRKSLVQIRVYSLASNAIDDCKDNRMRKGDYDLGALRRKCYKDARGEGKEEDSDKRGHQQLHFDSIYMYDIKIS